MRWAVVAVFSYILLALEVVLRAEVFRDATVQPSVLVPFIVYLALSAPQQQALWTGLALGLAYDMVREPGLSGTVLGPYALGYAAMAYLVVTMRALMMRRSPVAIMFLSAVGMLLAEVIVVALFSARQIWGQSGYSPGSELLKSVLSSGATALSGGVMAAVLLPMNSLFGFQDPYGRRFARRVG